MHAYKDPFIHLLGSSTHLVAVHSHGLLDLAYTLNTHMHKLGKTYSSTFMNIVYKFVHTYAYIRIIDYQCIPLFIHPYMHLHTPLFRGFHPEEYHT